MDRIDIQIDVPAVPYKELSTARGAESSEIDPSSRVVAARNIQLRRFFDEHIYTNAQMGPRQSTQVLRADAGVRKDHGERRHQTRLLARVATIAF